MPSPRPRRVTLRDVAAHADVSPTTVSFVLSGRRDMRISSATEDRVLQAARVLGYRRRLSPRTTPRPGSPAIGLVSDAIGTEAFAGEMIRGCIAAASEHGYTVLMAESQDDPHLEAAAIEALLGRGVEHIVYGVQGTRRVTVPRALDGVRTTLLNCLDKRHPGPAVVPHEYAAGRQAAEAVLEAGHTDRIWLVGEVPAIAYAGRRRLAGIRAAMKAAGVTLAGHVECGWWPDATRPAVAATLASGRPSAVIAINDRVAMGVYQAAAALHLSVPDDLSVISFDNSDLARWVEPGLTSIVLPHFDMGRRAVELVLDEDAPRGVHTIPMPLRLRSSVARPAPASRGRRHASVG